MKQTTLEALLKAYAQLQRIIDELYQIRLNEHTNGRGTALLCPYKYHVQSTGFDMTGLCR